MIDLHMHTTASDGRCTPVELVHRLLAVGIDTFSVTDHDTVAAVQETAALAAASGLEFVPGIEITAVYKEKDVHVLGYFVEHDSPELAAFLASSRADRTRRARLIAERLAGLGVPIDIDAVLTAPRGGASGKAIARPLLGRALVEAGHVRDVKEAFDLYLGEGKPAYVGRHGAMPAEVVGIIRRAGGIASLAHPGSLGHDELIPDLVHAGLAAFEAYHSEHSPEVTDRYLSIARNYALAVSGGSDYHGEGTRRAEFFGVVNLPLPEFVRLKDAHQRSKRIADLDGIVGQGAMASGAPSRRS